MSRRGDPIDHKDSAATARLQPSMTALRPDGRRASHGRSRSTASHSYVRMTNSTQSLGGRAYKDLHYENRKY